MNGNTEVEQLLAQDLRQVAVETPVPPMPSLRLDAEARHFHRPWLPLLVAAAVVAIIVGTVVAVRGGPGAQREPQPVRPSPSGVSTDPPAFPYVDADGRLLVEGRQVAGTWGGVVDWRADAWLVRKPGGRLFLGSRGDDEPLGLGEPWHVLLSANGEYAAVLREDGERTSGHVQVFETRFGGEVVGTLDLYLGVWETEARLDMAAITDDGLVVFQSNLASMLWNPSTGEKIDLRATAAGQRVQGMSAAGPIWTDGDGGQAYVAAVDAAGHVRIRAQLPDALAAPNASGTSAVLAGRETEPADDVVTWATLRLHDLGSGATQVLKPPAGWRFGEAQWEDDDHLVVDAYDSQAGHGTMRCGVTENQCVLLEMPR